MIPRSRPQPSVRSGPSPVNWSTGANRFHSSPHPHLRHAHEAHAVHVKHLPELLQGQQLHWDGIGDAGVVHQGRLSIEGVGGRIEPSRRRHDQFPSGVSVKPNQTRSSPRTTLRPHRHAPVSPPASPAPPPPAPPPARPRPRPSRPAAAARRARPRRPPRAGRRPAACARRRRRGSPPRSALPPRAGRCLGLVGSDRWGWLVGRPGAIASGSEGWTTEGESGWLVG